MQTYALSWQQSAALAVAVLPVSYVAGRFGPRRLRAAAPFGTEIAIIAALYALWQRAGEIAVLGPDGALRRARNILAWEHDWHLPREQSLQPPLVHHPVLGQTANLYYATMHFTVMFIFLVWLFVRYRSEYPRVRRTMAAATAVCLMVQLIPVAPPRMLPQLGFVDIPDLYHQSVYGGGFNADQLSAMPSVHVVWAVLVGWYVVRLSPSRWRWIAATHTVLTVLVVVSTGNHFWADGIVGVAILVVCALVNNVLTELAHRWRAGQQPPDRADDPAPGAHPVVTDEQKTGMLR